MLIETVAVLKLAQWLEAEPKTRTRAFVARRLGLSAPAVSQWLLKRQRPEPPHRRMISMLTGGAVPEDDWLLPNERAAIDTLAKTMARSPSSRTGTDA